MAGNEGSTLTRLRSWGARIAPAATRDGVGGADHWFDRLHKASIGSTSRRTVLQAAIAVAGALVPGPPGVAAAKGKQRKKKRKKLGKKNKPQPPPCSDGACAAIPEWAGNRDEIGFCEFVCRQCDGDDPRDFCIERTGVDPVAVCCDVDESCCGDRCCRGSCCDPGAGRGRRCIGYKRGCCPDDVDSGTCDPVTQKCCAGFGCVYRTEECPNAECGESCARLDLECCSGACIDTDVDSEHCGGCDRPCDGTWEQCCDGRCLATRFDEAHCGSCRPCPAGLTCCDGECLDTRFNDEYCGTTCQHCTDRGWTCCDGSCVDLNSQESHCGACGAACQPGELCCHGVGRGCIPSCGGFCTC